MYHVLNSKDKSLVRDMILVFDDHHDFVDGALEQIETVC